MEMIIWNHKIIVISLELYNCVEIICIRKEWLIS